MDVYPSKRKIWGSIVRVVAIMLFLGFLAFAAISSGPNWLDWCVFAVLALFIAVGGRVLISEVREARRSVPLAHFDETGFECAVGGVTWENVAGVAVDRRHLVIAVKHLPDGWRHVTRDYLSQLPYGGPVDAETESGQIFLPLWDSKQRVLADVQRFHTVVHTAALADLGPASEPSSARPDRP